MNKEIEECPYDTCPSMIEKYENDELDDRKKNDLFAENETYVHNKYGYYARVIDEKVDEST